MMPRNRLISTTLLLYAATARAEIPSSLEPAYAKAVLAYNAKNFGQSLSLLKKLLAQSPDLPEFLELEALDYKAQNQDTQAQGVYNRLLELKKAAPPLERAPYQFELGSLYFKSGDFAKAQPEFQSALENGFNPGASHFFLGLVAYRQKDWLAAESHLESFRSVLVADLRPTASLYLAQAYSESGYGLGAIQAYFDARVSASESIGDPASSPEAVTASKSVLEAANQGLSPVAPSRLFSEVGLLIGYDSNPLTLPGGQSTGLAQQLGGGTSTNGAAQASGQSSPEAILLANLGYMTSPLDTVQLVPSYRLRFNYGDNPAMLGNFAYNTLSLYLNHHPLDRFNYGLKVEGNLIFQGQPDPSTGAQGFHPFILSGGVGPYTRWQFSPYWTFNAEAYLQPQKNYEDDQLNAPSLAQSGMGYHLKAGIKKTGGSRFFNPGFYLAYDLNDTNGTQFRSQTPDFSVDDDFKLTDKVGMIVGADFGIPVYFAASPGRVDKTISAYASVSWLAWRKLTVLATASYTSNVSNSADNEAAYGYDRATISGGASWALF